MARLCHDGLVIRHHSQLPEVQLKGEFQVAVGSTGKTATPTNLHYVLAIDTSGSMAGSAIRQVNEALDAIFDNLASATHAVSVHMVEYNHQAQRHMFLESKPSALYGSGSTSFQAAFRALGQLVEELHGSEALKPGDNLRICFMTDGEDNCGGVESAYRSLQGQLLKLKVASINSAVDVVAFGSSQVNTLLERVRCAGAQEGGYLFASQGDGPAVLKNMLELVFDAAEFSANCEVTTLVTCTAIGVQDVEATATLDETTGNYNFSVWGVLSSVAKENKSMTAEGDAGDPKESDNVVIWVNIKGKDYMNMGTARRVLVHDESAEFYELALDYCDQRVDALCTAATKHKLSSKQTEHMQYLLGMVGKLMRCKQINKLRRGELLLRRAEVQERLDSLHQLVEQASRATSAAHDEIVSRMSSLRFSGQLKARRQRALARRVTSNATMASLGTKLDEAAQFVDYTAITADMDVFYSCIMSCGTLTELMQDDASNVLGFGLSIRRPEAVVDAPTLIHVDQVGLTFLSRDSLLDALKYKLNIEDQVTVHGGFAMNLATPAAATVGVAREPINAWLPLYINKDHWRRAHLLLKPTLGFFCCMDPLAFHDYQLDVPLMVLGTMATRLGMRYTERSAQVFLAFQRTCRALLESEGLVAANNERLREFVSQPNKRLKHSLTTPTVVLGAWLVADPAVALEVQGAGFMVYMKMELLRRALGTVYKARSPCAEMDMLRQLTMGVAGEERLAEDEAQALLEKLVCGGSSDDIVAPALSEPGAVASEYCATPSSTVLKLTVSKPLHRALCIMGKKRYDAVPGPNIQRKVHDAEKMVYDWWEEAFQTARLLMGESDSAQQLLADIHYPTPSKMTSLAKTLADARSAMYPTIGHLRSVEAIGNAWQGRSALLQDNGMSDGVPSVEAVAALRDSLTPLNWDVEGDYQWLRHGMDWKLQRDMMVTCLQLHSNKDARAAAEQQVFPDPFRHDFTERALHRLLEGLQQSEAAALEKQAQSLRLPVAVNLMLEATDMDLFLGVLALSCQDRDGTYKELLALLLSDATQAPLLGEKLGVLISGRYRDCRVFARGNPEMPQGTANEQLQKKMGDDAYYALRQTVKAVVRNRHYRESDIANRHGSSNSNPHEPWNCPLCQANGNISKW